MCQGGRQSRLRSRHQPTLGRTGGNMTMLTNLMVTLISMRTGTAAVKPHGMMTMLALASIGLQSGTNRGRSRAQGSRAQHGGAPTGWSNLLIVVTVRT